MPAVQKSNSLHCFSESSSTSQNATEIHRVELCQPPQPSDAPARCRVVKPEYLSLPLLWFERWVTTPESATSFSTVGVRSGSSTSFPQLSFKGSVITARNNKNGGAAMSEINSPLTESLPFTAQPGSKGCGNSTL